MSTCRTACEKECCNPLWISEQELNWQAHPSFWESIRAPGVTGCSHFSSHPWEYVHLPVSGCHWGRQLLSGTALGADPCHGNITPGRSPPLLAVAGDTHTVIYLCTMQWSRRMLVTCSAPSRQMLMLRACSSNASISLLAFQTQPGVNRTGLNYSFPSGRVLLVKMGVL